MFLPGPGQQLSARRCIQNTDRQEDMHLLYLCLLWLFQVLSVPSFNHISQEKARVNSLKLVSSLPESLPLSAWHLTAASQTMRFGFTNFNEHLF